ESVRRSLSNLQVAVQQANAQVIFDRLPLVRVHQVLLDQLFQNLIGNAIKYRKEEPLRIHIAAQWRDGQWLFSVSDNGIGIDSQYKEQIFGIFKRLHTSSEYSGTGIGLAICQRIVERSGGRIWVESEPGKGSTFFFTLPGEQGSECDSDKKAPLPPPG
ncbi:MAG TPA: ATP-binding protein, partial [Bryobacteraceae bacterium]|nr:ATP-binding protein [Bryobacteraceae bacterium]